MAESDFQCVGGRFPWHRVGLIWRIPDESYHNSTRGAGRHLGYPAIDEDFDFTGGRVWWQLNGCLRVGRANVKGGTVLLDRGRNPSLQPHAVDDGGRWR